MNGSGERAGKNRTARLLRFAGIDKKTDCSDCHAEEICASDKCSGLKSNRTKTNGKSAFKKLAVRITSVFALHIPLCLKETYGKKIIMNGI